MLDAVLDDECYTLVNDTGMAPALIQRITEWLRTGLQYFDPTAELRRTR